MARSPGAAQLLTVAAATALAIPYALLVVAGSEPDLNLDDSFITLVYARNLAHEGGLFYDAADGPLDGFTSLLDVVVKAAAIRMWPADAYRASIAVNRLYLAALVLAAGWFGWLASRRGWGAGWPAVALVPWLVASSWDVAAAATTELEAPLYALLGIVCVYALPLGTRASPGALIGWAVCVVALPLARPEGLVVSLVLLAGFAVSRLRGDRARWIVPVVCAGALCAYYAWRVAIFGYWAPNTYYAKTSDSRWLEVSDGLAFLVAYARHSLLDALKLAVVVGAPALALVPACVAGWPDRATRVRFALASGVATLSIALVVYAGGDSYTEARRLLVLPMTLLVLLPFQLLAHRDARLRVCAAAALGVLTLAYLPSGIARSADALRALAAGGPVVVRFPVECVREVSDRLVAIAADGAIAQSDFQMLKFFAPDQRVIDLHGLNDRSIAHRPEPGRVTFGKFSQADGIAAGAEVYVFGARLWTDEPMARHPLRALLADPDLHREFAGYDPEGDFPAREKLTPAQVDALASAYVAASLRGCGSWFNFLVRRDVATRATGPGLVVGR